MAGFMDHAELPLGSACLPQRSIRKSARLLSTSINSNKRIRSYTRTSWNYEQPWEDVSTFAMSSRGTLKGNKFQHRLQNLAGNLLAQKILIVGFLCAASVFSVSLWLMNSEQKHRGCTEKSAFVTSSAKPCRDGYKRQNGPRP